MAPLRGWRGGGLLPYSGRGRTSPFFWADRPIATSLRGLCKQSPQTTSLYEGGLTGALRHKRWVNFEY